ncbi:MAG: COR domain-containing protein [Cyanobacteria bacterium P01_F01_bin.150]
MDENYIPFEKYRDICNQDGETDSSHQDSLAVHLHSLGIALNDKDDPRLRDTHVLNPHWVNNGIYTLLNVHELADTNGELESACLSRTLDTTNYPPERHGFLLDLMRKFELCFRFQEDDHRYLIPDLLDKQQPAVTADSNPAECLNFRYEYPILPAGLLPRFIVRTHILSAPTLRWRTGVILEFEGNRALVRGDRQQRSVSINIQGPAHSRRRLLAIICSDFDRIHSSFKFTPTKRVPIPGNSTVTVSYEELLAREKQGRKSFDVLSRQRRTAGTQRSGSAQRRGFRGQPRPGISSRSRHLGRPSSAGHDLGHSDYCAALGLARHSLWRPQICAIEWEGGNDVGQSRCCLVRCRNGDQTGDRISSRLNMRMMHHRSRQHR